MYCPRRAALKLIEGWRSANQHTHRGDIVHEHTDLAGYEVAGEVILLRALPVYSNRLGLNGKCDIVERHTNGALFPVEFKVGKRRQWENDDAQLCAQALCLEEMFGTPIPRGAVFHADSKRRRGVEFTDHLRDRTITAIAELHSLLRSASIPAARYREGACEECSLFDVCLPQLTDPESRLKASFAARRLFQT